MSQGIALEISACLWEVWKMMLRPENQKYRQRKNIVSLSQWEKHEYLGVFLPDAMNRTVCIWSHIKAYDNNLSKKSIDKRRKYN